MTTTTSRQNREREAEGVPVIAVAATGDETRRRSRAAGEDASSASAVSPGWPPFRPPLPFAFAAFLLGDLGCASLPSLPPSPHSLLLHSAAGHSAAHQIDVHNAALQIKVTYRIPPALALPHFFRRLSFSRFGFRLHLRFRVADLSRLVGSVWIFSSPQICCAALAFPSGFPWLVRFPPHALAPVRRLQMPASPP